MLGRPGQQGMAGRVMEVRVVAVSCPGAGPLKLLPQPLRDWSLKWSLGAKVGIAAYQIGGSCILIS